VPHKIRTTENVLIPAGLLESDPGMRPEYCIFWGSKAPWHVETHELPKHEQYGA
jgi:hypothetical protein